MPMMLLMRLKNLLSFYLYPVLCFDISPGAGVLAAACFLLGAVIQGVLLCKRKKSARFPALCALAAVVPFVLIYLSDVLDNLIDRRVHDIPLIHHNILIHSNFGLYVIAFSVLAAYALLGVLAGWTAYRLLRRRRTF